MVVGNVMKVSLVFFDCQLYFYGDLCVSILLCSMVVKKKQPSASPSLSFFSFFTLSWE